MFKWIPVLAAVILFVSPVEAKVKRRAHKPAPVRIEIPPPPDIKLSDSPLNYEEPKEAPVIVETTPELPPDDKVWFRTAVYYHMDNPDNIGEI
jgi:hypothetical protein